MFRANRQHKILPFCIEILDPLLLCTCWSKELLSLSAVIYVCLLFQDSKILDYEGSDRFIPLSHSLSRMASKQATKHLTNVQRAKAMWCPSVSVYIFCLTFEMQAQIKTGNQPTSRRCILELEKSAFKSSFSVLLRNLSFPSLIIFLSLAGLARNIEWGTA